MPTSSRIVSALCSRSREALLVEDLERRELAGQERDVLGVAWRGAAPGGPARPPLRRRGGVVHQPSFRCRSATDRRRRRSARAPRLASSAGSPTPRSGSATTSPRCGKRGGLVREGHRLDEVLLEARLDRGLDLLDAPHDALDLRPRRARQERDERAGAGRVAGRPDVGEVAVGDEAEDHRVDRVDLAAERAGQADLVDLVDRRAGPSAAGRRRRARPWPAGSPGRRSG